MIENAAKDLDALAAILKREGVIVKRPDKINFAKPFNTLDWKKRGRVICGNARDVLMVIGRHHRRGPDGLAFALF